MRLVKINIRFDKISNMLFLNDLSLFEVFQKVRLNFIFRYHQSRLLINLLFKKQHYMRFIKHNIFINIYINDV